MRTLLKPYTIGLRLLLPLPLPAGLATEITLRELGKLLLLVVAIKFLGDSLALLSLSGAFNPYGFTDIATQLLLLIACAWLWTLSYGAAAGVRMLGLAACAWPWTLLLDSCGTALLLHTDALPDSGIGYQVNAAVPLLQGFILLRALLASASRKTLGGAFWIVALPTLLLCSRFYLPNEMLWTVQEQEDPNSAAFSQLDLETLWTEQPALLEAQFMGLAAPDSEQPDTYFLGFTAYPYPNVFKRETERAQTLFQQHYGAVQRSFMLMNHLDTYETVPLATVSNLRLTLDQLGQGMDISDDVLVLYLGSHGTEAGEVAVEFGNLPLNNLTPETLRTALDGAGIRWRIIIVSACYSGAFAPALADPYSLIITAARADRASFGCDDSSEFTYFGEAILSALAQSDDFPVAFQQAAAAIREREQREFPRDPASEPQFVLGAALAQRLPVLRARWTALRKPLPNPNTQTISPPATHRQSAGLAQQQHGLRVGSLTP